MDKIILEIAFAPGDVILLDAAKVDKSKARLYEHLYAEGINGPVFPITIAAFRGSNNEKLKQGIEIRYSDSFATKFTENELIKAYLNHIYEHEIETETEPEQPNF